MHLRFPAASIAEIAARYECPPHETDLMNLKPQIERQGHLTMSQLKSLAEWKSPRSAGRVERNSEVFLREVSAFSLAATDERSRIEPLTLLDGVLWPTASVVLHLFHRENYPILDFRALWSVTTAVPVGYDVEFWMAYVKFTREVAKSEALSMRVLDRALWQYSKENQPATSAA